MSMYTCTRSFKLFAEADLSEYLRALSHAPRGRVESEKEDYVLNVNEESYIQHLVDSATVDPPVLRFDDIEMEDREVQVPVDRYPGGNFDYGRTTSGSVPCTAFVFHVPFNGDEQILRCTPSTRLLWHTDACIENGSLVFEIVSHYTPTSEQIQSQLQSTLMKVKEQLGHVLEDIERHNAQIPRIARDAFQAQKKRILDKRNLVASIGVPIKKRADIPSTFAAPVPKVQKSLLSKPSVSDRDYNPHPTLDDTVYQDILQTLHDIGKAFERFPSTYAGKEEEDLRDHFLLTLQPRYKSGSATGETFNKKGKTDILIQYENSILFIGECKFWTGEAGYLKTISQLLGYLTWRDSKAAVVMFVRNKDVSSVLEVIGRATPTHPNHLRFLGRSDDSWFTYRFHINDDANREVKLAVLVFHLPIPTPPPKKLAGASAQSKPKSPPVKR